MDKKQKAELKKSLKNALHLSAADKIMYVAPIHAAGPGWQNQPLWVVISRGGVLVEECLQPEEQPEAVRTLYLAGSVIHRQMVAALENALV